MIGFPYAVPEAEAQAQAAQVCILSTCESVLKKIRLKLDCNGQKAFHDT
jgi:hypothetical protein